ncbi:MAG: DUF523 and DUF1722 domain-containing protein [Myxococcota bacterium]|nr:DUF523 and DUF1722 domain-containing protein [Myxococcota bacterium]
MSEDELPLRVGVSSCLLGNEVRYDAGHKRDRFLTETLAPFVEWVPVCPEVESGMGVPRPTIRLVWQGGEVELREVESGKDHTRRMARYAAKRVRDLRALELHGFVLKKKSPSCGLERVPVYGPRAASRNGRGLFAGTLVDALPSLPVEEEGRLHDARLRENFIERLFAYRRLRTLFRGRVSTGRVVAFHTAHKLQVMAHSPAAYRELGRLVARIKETPRPESCAAYETGFMNALARAATPGRNVSVLQHAAGYLKKQLDEAGRSELAESIQDYQRGYVPLIVPITLLRHHVHRFAIDDLAGQTFLEPHPRELMLRNHV